MLLLQPFVSNIIAMHELQPFVSNIIAMHVLQPFVSNIIAMHVLTTSLFSLKSFQYEKESGYVLFFFGFL